MPYLGVCFKACYVLLFLKLSDINNEHLLLELDFCLSSFTIRIIYLYLYSFFKGAHTYTLTHTHLACHMKMKCVHQ